MTEEIISNRKMVLLGAIKYKQQPFTDKIINRYDPDMTDSKLETN